MKANDFRELFLLDKDVIYLNHGSFGACPKTVMEILFRWQKQLEAQPVRFMENELMPQLEKSRHALGEFVGCNGDDLVYFPNPTTALNAVIRSLDLQPGDEILTTDHEYGAMERTWRYYCRKTGAVFRKVEIPVPVKDHSSFIQTFWGNVNSNTRVIFISQITSPTALIFPVTEICRRARERGITTIVDGAHAPGHIPLNIGEMNPDVFAGACHKWMCSPKGTSFLYVKKSLQDTIDPLVISWGWESDRPGKSQFLDYHQWQGTRDMCAFLTVPESIEYLRSIGWFRHTKKCHSILMVFQEKLIRLLNTERICREPEEWQGQMCSIILPYSPQPEELKKKLSRDYGIEIPVFNWKDKTILRISCQPYNSESELEVLFDAVSDCLL